MNTKYQPIKIRVTSAGQSVKVSANTNMLFAEVRGLRVSISDDRHHFASTIGLRIDEEEIFPDEYETKLLFCNQSAKINEYFEFDQDEFVNAADSKVEIKYVDGGFTDGVTFPYDAVLYLKLKNPPTVKKPNQCCE
ncbi:MAG: hypothetical protein NTW49_08825 [Bacteroidia bacterium]|nr:hypothetical protein [Bacteroidia bacterium]